MKGDFLHLALSILEIDMGFSYRTFNKLYPVTTNTELFMDYKLGNTWRAFSQTYCNLSLAMSFHLV